MDGVMKVSTKIRTWPDVSFGSNTLLFDQIQKLFIGYSGFHSKEGVVVVRPAFSACLTTGLYFIVGQCLPVIG